MLECLGCETGRLDFLFAVLDHFCMEQSIAFVDSPANRAKHGALLLKSICLHA